MTKLINFFLTTSQINQNGERKRYIHFTEKPFLEIKSILFCVKNICMKMQIKYPHYFIVTIQFYWGIASIIILPFYFKIYSQGSYFLYTSKFIICKWITQHLIKMQPYWARWSWIWVSKFLTSSQLISKPAFLQTTLKRKASA